MKSCLVLIGCLLCLTLPARGALPVVAVHDSELTRALETTPASGATPTGAGTTGFQWWPSQWHYHVMPESVREALRSDGTAFTTVTDAAIAAGGLLDAGGQPRYPIVISLAAEAIPDENIAAFTNYVAGGGFLVVGSSAFTRFTNGVTRGDFAFANQLGVHMVNANLLNWTNNFLFTKCTNHRLVAHIPGGPLTWQMPSAADEVSWPYQGVFAPERTWQVVRGDAIELARGDLGSYLLIKRYGKGYFIYHAGMDPLIGHGGYAPGMYAYLIFRRAIEWAFETAQLPVPRLSPWPYPYDAAFMVRHDLENFGDEISAIAPSAQFEQANGVKGDYYFCTGTLRVELTNSPAVIAGLRQATTNYGATIGPHNGGLPNPQNGALPISAYDYWHWGPDQAYNVASNDLPLPGFSNGVAYAFLSLSNSFADMDGWLAGITNSTRSWVSPYFNATRETSYQLEEQLGVKVTGDVKLTPFPHWTTSTQTAGKHYPLLQIPVSDWYVLNQYQQTQVSQSVETGHTPGSVHEATDFYYALGALINIYSHSLSLGGNSVQDYIRYAMNTNLHPRLWPANSLGIYGWWLQRSNAQFSASFSTNGTDSVINLNVTGATDPQTAAEIFIPGASVSALRVFTNGIAASNASYRTNGRVIRVLVGTTITNAQIRYLLNPTAQPDTYLGAGSALSVPSPGVLANDRPGSGTNLSAILLNGPGHGTLSLSNSGGFSYTPDKGFAGIDCFTYFAKDDATNSLPAAATLDVPLPGGLFFDDFTRLAQSPPLSPWTVGVGQWTITNGMLRGTGLGENDFAEVYAGNPDWTDYAVEGRLQIPIGTGAYEAGLSGRVDPLTGRRYVAAVLPEDSPAGGPALRLMKMATWRSWSFNPMTQVPLPGVGTNWHTLKMSFHKNQIRVCYDGVQVADVIDDAFDGVPAYTNGAAGTQLYVNALFTATFDDFSITPLRPNLNATVVNGALQISWSTDFTGWTLQAQANATEGGLGNAWSDIAGSSATNQVTVPLDAGNGSAFYRLISPQF